MVCYFFLIFRSLLFFYSSFSFIQISYMRWCDHILSFHIFYILICMVMNRFYGLCVAMFKICILSTLIETKYGIEALLYSNSTISVVLFFQSFFFVVVIIQFIRRRCRRRRYCRRCRRVCFCNLSHLTIHWIWIWFFLSIYSSPNTQIVCTQWVVIGVTFLCSFLCRLLLCVNLFLHHFRTARNFEYGWSNPWIIWWALLIWGSFDCCWHISFFISLLAFAFLSLSLALSVCMRFSLIFFFFLMSLVEYILCNCVNICYFIGDCLFLIQQLLSYSHFYLYNIERCLYIAYVSLNKSII